MIKVYIIAVLVVVTSAWSQVVLLTGQVFELNAATVSGAGIVLQYTSLRTVTDADGKFVLEGVIGEETSINHPDFRHEPLLRLNKNSIYISVQGMVQNTEIFLHNLQGKQIADIFSGQLGRGNHEFPLPAHITGRTLLIVKLGSQTKTYQMAGNGWDVFISSFWQSREGETDVLAKLHQTEDPESLVVSKEGYITRTFPLNQTWSWPREIMYEDDLEVIVLYPVSGNDIYADSRQSCVDRVNGFRSTIGLPALDRWTEQENCVDAEARLDSESGRAHGAYGNCGEMSQNECPGWNSVEQTIQGCIQSMWNEGPGPDGCADDPQCYQEHGHYINMTNTSITKVACGFYTTPGGKVWAIQNFR
jgi:hypothetical protein